VGNKKATNADPAIQARGRVVAASVAGVYVTREVFASSSMRADVCE